MQRYSIRYLVALLVLLHLAPRPASSQNQAAPEGTVIVANMNDNTATILDAGSNAVLATLPTGPAPHEIAVSKDGRTAVITNYGTQGAPGNSLTVIDIPTLSVSRTIDLGIYQRPHGIAYQSDGRTVAVTSEANGVVVVVNVSDGRIFDAIKTEQRASHMMASSSDGRHLFVTNIVDGTVTVINSRAGAVSKTIPVAPFVEGIASSPDGKTIWVGSNKRKTVSVVDIASGVVTDSLTGFGFPYRMAVTPDGSTAILSDPMNSEIRIVSTESRTELKRIKVPSDGVQPSAEFANSAAPEGIAVASDNRFAFVSLQGRNAVATIDISSGTITAVTPTGVWPDGIGYSPYVRQ